MERFRYLSSADHAAWYVPHDHKGKVYLSIDNLAQHPGKRYEIKEWVETNCKGSVLAWNNTSTPVKGQAGWEKMIVPSGDISMFFELEEDRMLFQLTWC